MVSDGTGTCEFKMLKKFTAMLHNMPIILGVLQIISEQGRERKGREQLQSGPTNQIPDLDTTQLAQTPGRNYTERQSDFPLHNAILCHISLRITVAQDSALPSNVMSSCCVFPPGGASSTAR